MGGQQSSHAAGAAGAASTAKTCYYELLGVPLTATDEEIKKAYRQRALELHPDRNYGDTENSTRRFADVQSAYEVLSDPQERAWYDSHRDAILDDRDPDDSPPEFHNVRITTSNDLLSLTQRFNRAIPMTDEPDGFFAVLRETFDRLAAEEDLACRVAGQAPTPYSRFGGERDTFDDTVKLFYRDWLNFSTAKSFAWEDLFRLSDARDRRERRAMEMENKRVRQEATREFNETVLFFVAFVRKRDPRVVMDKRTAAERQMSMKEASAAQAARSRAANQRRLAEMSVPPVVASPAPAQPAEPELPDTEDDESAEVVEIECVVCNKRFKSENQFEAHERSKKHLKAAQRLRSEMKKDDRLLNPKPAPPPADQDAASLPEQQDGRAADLEQEVVAVGESNEADGDESAAIHLSARLAGAQIRDRVKSDGTSIAADEGHGPHVASSIANGDRAAESTSTHPSPRLAGTSTDDNAEADSHSTHENDDEYASRADVADRLGRDGTTDTSSTTSSPTRALGPQNLVEEDTLSSPDTAAVRKKGKAKMRREKKAARQAASAQDRDSALTCASCQETFPSRSKLFSHIKALGHAAPPPPR